MHWLHACARSTRLAADKEMHAAISAMDPKRVSTGGSAGCDEDGTGQAQRTDEADHRLPAAVRNSVHEVPRGWG